MKFLTTENEEVKLEPAAGVPGYNIVLREDVLIKSPINNPFFKGLKGVNLLQLPKKMKGFRDNSDLDNFLVPTVINTGIKVELDEKQFIIFRPNDAILKNKKLHSSVQIFTDMVEIAPSIINYGLHNVKLSKETIIGDIIIMNATL